MKYVKQRLISLYNQFSATAEQLREAKASGNGLKQNNCAREIDILRARIQELGGVLGAMNGN